MDIKMIIKGCYMHFCHIRIYLTAEKIGMHCFIGKRVRINKCRYLSMDDNCRIGNDCRLSFYNEFYGKQHKPELQIHRNAYLGDYLTILCADRVIIERDVLMASHIMITTENHGMDPEAEACYGKQPLTTAPVRIGEGSWIGEKVIILPGVEIGKKSIVAGGAVVTKSIPPYSIAAGNPAKVIKRYNLETHKWEKM